MLSMLMNEAELLISIWHSEVNYYTKYVFRGEVWDLDVGLLSACLCLGNQLKAIWKNHGSLLIPRVSIPRWCNRIKDPSLTLLPSPHPASPSQWQPKMWRHVSAKCWLQLFLILSKDSFRLSFQKSHTCTYTYTHVHA